MNEEIVFPRRAFRDVHQLVFLFQSWQLLIEAADLPPALRPLREIPAHLEPVVTRALRSARDQLDEAQAGTDIALRFPVTQELVELMRWAASRLAESADSIGSTELDPAWAGALTLARELVDAAIVQVGAEADRLS